MAIGPAHIVATGFNPWDDIKGQPKCHRHGSCFGENRVPTVLFKLYRFDNMETNLRFLNAFFFFPRVETRGKKIARGYASDSDERSLLWFYPYNAHRNAFFLYFCKIPIALG